MPDKVFESVDPDEKPDMSGYVGVDPIYENAATNVFTPDGKKPKVEKVAKESDSTPTETAEEKAAREAAEADAAKRAAEEEAAKKAEAEKQQNTPPTPPSNDKK